jgi:hypothetical protein
MITIQDIQKWSRPHPVVKGGRMTNIFNSKYELLVVVTEVFMETLKMILKLRYSILRVENL